MLANRVLRDAEVHGCGLRVINLNSFALNRVCLHEKVLAIQPNAENKFIVKNEFSYSCFVFMRKNDQRKTACSMGFINENLCGQFLIDAPQLFTNQAVIKK